MSATLVRLRKRAAELEQKKQFDRALEVYVQILDEGGKDLGDEDVPLFNRVGDMLMRKGSVTEALGYYERAVDMYAERGYLNNAIALCSKILRQSPGRAAVYYKLARISAKKGFKSDARKNFLEYADRMQKLGMADEAFRALKEFASLYPDQDDVRLVLAELLSKENRKGEALEQLQSLYEKLQSEGRAAEARATIDRMRAIDPSVTPHEGTGVPTPAAGDLVFLDLTDSAPPGSTPRRGDTAQPASARAPEPTPVPALTGLSITFFPSEEEAQHPVGFESTAVEPEPVQTAPAARSLTPAATELLIEPAAPSRSSTDDVEAIVPFDMIESTPPRHTSAEVELLDDLLPEPDKTERTEQAPPARSLTPLSSFAFADLELDDAPREQAPREHDLALPGSLPVTPDEVATVTPDEVVTVTPNEVATVTPDEVATVTPDSPASAAAGDDARAAAEEAADLAADIAAREAIQITHSPAMSAPTVPQREPEPEPDDLEPLLAREDVLERTVEKSDAGIPDDFLALPPSFGVTEDPVEEHAFPPLFGLDESAAGPETEATETEAAPLPEQRHPTPRATISIGSAESHLRRRLELEPENYELRRQLGEALLDTGDRDGGLYELELAMVGFELLGELDRAQEVVDEILGVFPASVGHHQKRVEYAVRSRDRGRLTHSYLELADALFRTGAGDKAVAVYSRVLELDHTNERAEFALATLAPDELVRLRGVPARPERWTDELVALKEDVGRKPETSDRVDEPEPSAPVHEPESSAPVHEPAAPDEEPDHQPLNAEQEAEAKNPDIHVPESKVESIELPDPEWGEGTPATAIQVAAPSPIEEERHYPSPVEEERYYPSPEEEERHSDERTFEDHAPVAPSEPPVEEEQSIADRAVEALEELTVAAPVDQASNEPVEPEVVPAPRSPTPWSVPTTPPDSPRPVQPRAEPPMDDSDSEFVDLGEWLRRTEPTRSTRMQVEDPKPTGDEQADFEEMLRRFKRGVAENVEAEDYDAHYDLGVAYKEMGLLDEAIAQFQKALRGASHRVRSYEALGQCFVEKKQYPIAAALLQRATEVPGSDDQQLVGVLYLLGFATEHLGRPAEALAYYLRVFAVDIEFRDIADRVAAMGNFTK